NVAQMEKYAFLKCKKIIVPSFLESCSKALAQQKKEVDYEDVANFFIYFLVYFPLSQRFHQLIPLTLLPALLFHLIYLLQHLSFLSFFVIEFLYNQLFFLLLFSLIHFLYQRLYSSYYHLSLMLYL